MKKSLLVLLLVGAAAIFPSCQKQQTEEERKAEVEREVQDRLAAERQTQQQEQLNQRQAELDAREKALADSQAAATQPETVSTPNRSREIESSAADRRPEESYDLFYTRLEPHGSWLETQDYGYVWQPREARSSSWRPYMNGHWVYTDAGWTWVSDEPFGWATYHYGRWARLRNVGWIWVPGEEWAPAWVSWRKSDDYVGWAPLPPESHFDRRKGIHNWADNYYDIGPAQYCFVPTPKLGAARMEQAVVPAEQNITIINRTTNVTNITYNNVTVVNQGPSYDELRTRTQQPIPRLKLERQVTVSAAAQSSGPVVRGEVIEMAAPVVQRAQRAERPRDVRQTIARSEVDHGWAELGDNEAVRQARAKMKSEATPPADAPAKTMVGSDRRSQPDLSSPSAATSQTPALSSGRPATTTPSPSASISATVETMPSVSPSSTPTRSPVERHPSPAATASSQTPTATPASIPRSTATPTALPRNTAFPPPAGGADNERPRVGGPLKSQAKKFQPSHVEPMPSLSPQPNPSASAKPSTTPVSTEGGAVAPETPRQPIYQRPEGLRRRPLPPRERPGVSPAESTPAASIPPSPTGESSPSGQSKIPDQRRGRPRLTGSPAPTATPTP